MKVKKKNKKFQFLSIIKNFQKVENYNFCAFEYKCEMKKLKKSREI